MSLISIIIPVYNAEFCLPRCLNSILDQDFKDFELLLVDDGSVDGSGGICDEYSEKDARIRVFHKENGGVSSARNLGLKEANGTWICFVDADDEMMPNGLKVMTEGISEDIGMIMAGFHEVEDGKLLTDTSLMGMNAKTICKREALLFMYPSVDLVYMGYPWGKLFNNRIVKDCGITFNEHIAIKEDTLFVVNYLCQICKPVYFTLQPVYKYMKTSSGAMGSLSVSYNPKYLTSFEAVIEMNRWVQKLSDLDKKLSGLSKYEVINRCYLIYGHMLQTNAIDKVVFTELKKRAKEEVGLGYYLGFQFHRNWRRIKKKLRIK